MRPVRIFAGWVEREVDLRDAVPSPGREKFASSIKRPLTALRFSDGRVAVLEVWEGRRVVRSIEWRVLSSFILDLAIC